MLIKYEVNTFGMAAMLAVWKVDGEYSRDSSYEGNYVYVTQIYLGQMVKGLIISDPLLPM